MISRKFKKKIREKFYEVSKQINKIPKKNWEILINILLIFSVKLLGNFSVISRKIRRKYGKSLRKF